MQQVKLEAQKRQTSGKGAARGMRRAGNLPGVLYGRKNEVIPIQINARGFRDFLVNYGENTFINLEIADHGTENVMVKDVQRDPVSNQLLHTDLLRISMDEPITSGRTNHSSWISPRNPRGRNPRVSTPTIDVTLPPNTST